MVCKCMQGINLECGGNAPYHKACVSLCNSRSFYWGPHCNGCQALHFSWSNGDSTAGLTLAGHGCSDSPSGQGPCSGRPMNRDSQTGKQCCEREQVAAWLRHVGVATVTWQQAWETVPAGQGNDGEIVAGHQQRDVGVELESSGAGRLAPLLNMNTDRSWRPRCSRNSLPNLYI